MLTFTQGPSVLHSSRNGPHLLSNQRIRSHSVVIHAAAAPDKEVKPKRTRKKAATKSSAEKTSTSRSSRSTASRVVEVHTDSLQRLQGSSDTLRELLERRAKRQQALAEALSPSSPSSPTTLVPSTSSSSLVGQVPAEAAPLKQITKVRFWINFHINYGENIFIIGGPPELGGWVLSKAMPMKWSDGDNWHTTIELPAGSIIEYKYVIVNGSGHAQQWQQGNNSVLALRHADDAIDVYDNWYGSPGAQVVAEGAPPATRENRLLSWATEIETQLTAQRQELRRARMELVAAQEETKLAREEARRYKAQVVQVESEKLAAISKLKQADTMNKVLQAQLTETTASFRQAMETAAEILSKLDVASTTGDSDSGSSTAASSTKQTPSSSTSTNGSSTVTSAVNGSTTTSKTPVGETTTNSNSSAKPSVPSRATGFGKTRAY